MGVFDREVKGKTSREVRYLMSDLGSEEVQRLGRSAREHWVLVHFLFQCLGSLCLRLKNGKIQYRR